MTQGPITSVKRKKPSKIVTLRRKIKETYRWMTASRRVFPDFIIIGAAKAGTTSLYNYLNQHPDILPCFKKEVHYFDYGFYRSQAWYKSFFPYASELKNPAGVRKITGESSPYYLYHPEAPRRLAEVLPQRKLICILRNPIDRAISNYNHMVRLGLETLPMEEAFDREPERIAGEEIKLKDPGYFSNNHFRHSYLTRGIYADQLKRWLDIFPSEDLLILNSEEFFENPATVFKQVLEHLSLPWAEGINFKAYNTGGENYMNLDPQYRRKLVEFYRPHNERLFKMLNVKYDWDK